MARYSKLASAGALVLMVLAATGFVTGCGSSSSSSVPAAIDQPAPDQGTGNEVVPPPLPTPTTGRVALYRSPFSHPSTGALHLFEPLTFNGVEADGTLCWVGEDDPSASCDGAHSVARSTADQLTRLVLGDYVFEPPTRNGHVRGNFYTADGSLDLGSLDRSPGNLFRVDPTTGALAIEYDTE